MAIMGHVQNLDEFFMDKRVSIAPLRFGAGVKGKIASAMSCGLPTVATSTAVDGMGLSSNQNILIGDTAETFAELIMEVYQNELRWQEISDAGKEFVHKYYGLSATRQKLSQIFLFPFSNI